MSIVEHQPTEKNLWEAYLMALDRVTQQLERVCTALEEARIPFSIIGGQAVALWVASKDPAATRTTKDVDLSLDRSNLPAARAALAKLGMDYVEVMSVGMFLEKENPNPRNAVHLVWAGELVRPHDLTGVPPTSDRVYLVPGRPVTSLLSLVTMKLQAFRLHDQVHLHDMVDVGLIDRDMLANLPTELAQRLEPMLTERGK